MEIVKQNNQVLVTVPKEELDIDNIQEVLNERGYDNLSLSSAKRAKGKYKLEFKYADLITLNS